MTDMLCNRSSLKVAIRYCISGGCGFLANMSIFLLLDSVGVHYIVASLVAFFGGMVISFLLQKFLTFSHRTMDGATQQFVLHLTLVCLNAVANTLIIYLLVSALDVPKIAGQVMTNIIIAIWSFFAYRYVVFAEKQTIQTHGG